MIFSNCRHQLPTKAISTTKCNDVACSCFSEKGYRWINRQSSVISEKPSGFLVSAERGGSYRNWNLLEDHSLMDFAAVQPSSLLLKHATSRPFRGLQLLAALVPRRADSQVLAGVTDRRSKWQLVVTPHVRHYWRDLNSVPCSPPLHVPDVRPDWWVLHCDVMLRIVQALLPLCGHSSSATLLHRLVGINRSVDPARKQQRSSFDVWCGIVGTTNLPGDRNLIVHQHLSETRSTPSKLRQRV